MAPQVSVQEGQPNSVDRQRLSQYIMIYVQLDFHSKFRYEFFNKLEFTQERLV